MGGFPSNQTRYSLHEGENLPKQKVLAQAGLSTQEASRLGLLLQDVIERHLEVRIGKVSQDFVGFWQVCRNPTNYFIDSVFVDIFLFRNLLLRPTRQPAVKRNKTW